MLWTLVSGYVAGLVVDLKILHCETNDLKNSYKYKILLL